MVRWLHISDLHIVEKADWNHFKKELLRKCQEQGKIDLVIVTGDFHNFSDHDDFHLAIDFLQHLIGHLGLDIEQDLFVVPGNHDGVTYVEYRDIFVEACKNDPFDKMKQCTEALLMAFQGYEAFVKELIPNYPEEHPARVHSRIWRNKINFIHCNTALVADGKEKINQLLDIDALADADYMSDMPNIILAHNSFFDLHEKHRPRVQDSIRINSICAYFSGDRHTQEFNEIPTGEGKVPCITSYKSAPDPTDNYSAFGIIFGEWENKQAKLTGWYWKSGHGFHEDNEITGKTFSLAPSAVSLKASITRKCPQETATGKTPQGMDSDTDRKLKETDTDADADGSPSDTRIAEYALKRCFIISYYQSTYQQRALFNQKHRDMQLLPEMGPVELSNYVNAAQIKGILAELFQDLTF